MTTYTRESSAPVNETLRALLAKGYRFNVIGEDGARCWTDKKLEEVGMDYGTLDDRLAFGARLAVDWAHRGCVVLAGDGAHDALEHELGEPVYCDREHVVYRGEHPGARQWRAGQHKGRFVAKSKQWFPVDLDKLLTCNAEPPVTDFSPILAKPKASKARLPQLKALEQDIPALLSQMFPGCEHRPEGEGWRVSTNGMTDNVAANPVGKGGELMFKDFGEPASFNPGDALSVMKQLSVSVKPSGRPPVADKPQVTLSAPVVKDDKRKMAQRVWRQALDLFEDDEEAVDGRAYLVGRGVKLKAGMERMMVRYEPHCSFGKGDYRECLVVATTADLNPGKGKDVTAIQRISIKGGAKKTLGKVEGAVNLSGQPVGETLGVAEGVVTGLAAQEIFSTPFVATLGTGGMKELNVPERVKTLLIAADNDSPGISAAKALARRVSCDVRIVMPSEPGTDFADEYGEVVDVPVNEPVVNAPHSPRRPA